MLDSLTKLVQLHPSKFRLYLDGLKDYLLNARVFVQERCERVETALSYCILTQVDSFKMLAAGELFEQGLCSCVSNLTVPQLYIL